MHENFRQNIWGSAMLVVPMLQLLLKDEVQAAPAHLVPESVIEHCELGSICDPAWFSI